LGRSGAQFLGFEIEAKRSVISSPRGPRELYHGPAFRIKLRSSRSTDWGRPTYRSRALPSWCRIQFISGILQRRPSQGWKTFPGNHADGIASIDLFVVSTVSFRLLFCIIRDRDCVYGDPFKRRLRAMGIRDRPTASRSPWQNGHAERLIGSIRRESLDHVVVFGERHRRHILLSYMEYYNGARTHLSLKKDTPIPRAVPAVGRILPKPILGGLHRQYIRI
jgi:hypothetical protein